MIRENDMSEFVKEISTYYKEDNKGKAVVCVNTKEELTFVNYYNEKDEFIKTTAFPDKSIRYAEDAAENWSLGYMEQCNIFITVLKIIKLTVYNSRNLWYIKYRIKGMMAV